MTIHRVVPGSIISTRSVNPNNQHLRQKMESCLSKNLSAQKLQRLFQGVIRLFQQQQRLWNLHPLSFLYSHYVFRLKRILFFKKSALASESIPGSFLLNASRKVALVNVTCSAGDFLGIQDLAWCHFLEKVLTSSFCKFYKRAQYGLINSLAREIIMPGILIENMLILFFDIRFFRWLASWQIWVFFSFEWKLWIGICNWTGINMIIHFIRLILI